MAARILRGLDRIRTMTHARINFVEVAAMKTRESVGRGAAAHCCRSDADASAETVQLPLLLALCSPPAIPTQNPPLRSVESEAKSDLLVCPYTLRRCGAAYRNLSATSTFVLACFSHGQSCIGISRVAEQCVFRALKCMAGMDW